MVVGVFSYTGMLGNTLSYADYQYVADINGTPEHASSYRVITQVHDRASQEALCAALDQHLRSLNLQVDEIEAGMVTREQASSAITILIVFLLGMALLTAFVGSVGLAGTMGMNVLERTREIGVMRAIGAVDLEIVKSVVIEGLLIGLISWGFAWALSFPISYVMLRIISTAMMSDPVAISFTLVGTLIWLGVVVVLSAIASIAPARSAARLTIREVLAYE
jgi:putative ABC transport system permease protein